MKRITRTRLLTAEEVASNQKVREGVKKDFPPLKDEIKVGDKVAVQDQRDGAIIEYTKVKAINKDGDKPYASVEAGYGVAVRCLLKVPPETNGHEWEWLPITRGSCAGSWRCKNCLTAYDLGCGRDLKCEPYPRRKP